MLKKVLSGFDVLRRNGNVRSSECYMSKILTLNFSRYFTLLLIFCLGFSSAGPDLNNNNNLNLHRNTNTNHPTISNNNNNNNNNNNIGNSNKNFEPTHDNNNNNIIQSNSIHDPHQPQQHQIINLNLTFIQDFERNCPEYCAEQSHYNHKEICMTQGCQKWKTGLGYGCSSVCSGTDREGNFRELYACQVGCSKAVEDYYNIICGLLGLLDAPTLTSDSLQSNSLELRWDGCSPQLPYLAFTIQRRIYQRNSHWETIPTTKPLNATSFQVDGLKPYTEYQFRIGWILATDFPPLYTLESKPITTRPKGRPNPPEITSIQPISNTSVSVTWIPPSQPNGRLVAYILKLHEIPNGNAIIKDIPIVHNPRGYTFSGLMPNTNYSLSISAQNSEGEGDAANIHFVTPQSSISNDISKRPEPRLILQGVRDVYMQQLELLVEPDVTVFASNQNITAIAAHFKYKWIFIATEDGQIVRKALDKNESLILFPRRRLDILAYFMSVDWLHNKLYILGKKKRSGASNTWCIKRCDLNGENLETIYPYLSTQPIDFTADPFTGFLYWVVDPTPNRPGGLFKMDMLLSDNAVPTPVIQTETAGILGPFTVDFVNYRILIVHRIKNTVLSVSLDGDETDIRQNTQSPQFNHVLSLTTFNGIFYGTTGQSVVIEEYNGLQKNFYHNSYDIAKRHQPCSRILIFHPDLQPIPIPMAPPTKAQVIMGTRQARVSWRPPPIMSGLGKSAWTNWKYQVFVSGNGSVSNVTENQFVLKNLRPSATYSIQVLAYSDSGRGPLSAAVKARTLKETAYNISLLWASQNGLYSTDSLGEHVNLLVSPNQWNGNPPTFSAFPFVSGGGSGRNSLVGGPRNFNRQFGPSYIWSLAWHDDASVLFALSNGSVFHYEAENKSTSPKLTQVLGISFAQSVAFDYIGQKIYWSDPKKQTILRCSLHHCNDSEENVEWLKVVTIAREICLDSFRGNLLWSTEHSLEMSRLNGYKHSVLYETGFFSGVKIQGFTIDVDLSIVYFITRSSSGSTLQRLSYSVAGARAVQIPRVVQNFPDVAISGPIRFFNERLIWLQSPGIAMLTDVTAQSRSSMVVETLSNITSIHVRDQSAQRYPGGLSKKRIQVIPNPVVSWSISIQGKWNNFTISWQRVNNTNPDTIFYEILLNNNISKVTMNNSIRIDNSPFPPFSDLEITITALTYWASSKPVLVRKQTPSAKPSEPKNPRIFLEKISHIYQMSKGNIVEDESMGNDSSLINGELRWDPPSNPNGHIVGYLIHCWKDSLKKSDCMCDGSVNKLSCEFRNMNPNSSYQFAVQAYTDAGAGNMSRRINANPSYNNPIPKLLITSEKLEIFDVDRNSVQPIPLGALSPISAAYLAVEDSIFWINEGQDVMKSHLVSRNKTRVLSLSGQGEASHLAVDWIGKRLFWVMEFPNREIKWAIMTLDLASVESVANPRASIIMTSRTPIKGITVNPFRSIILWTTSKNNGINTIFASRTDGSSPSAFLSRNNTKCNCSNCNSMGEPISFDSNGFQGLKRGILITNDRSIWLSDENGCECVQVINMTSHGFSQPKTPPYKIAGDSQHVFWTGGYLYASEKPGNGITELMSAGVREISILGPTAQPFPHLNCLIPRKLERATPEIFNHSSHSLHLQLPKATMLDCPLPDVSMASLKYKVFYGNVNENHGKPMSECTPTNVPSCRVITTSESLLHITGLFPYTTYTVFVTVTNIWAEMEGLEPLACSPIMLRTAPGAPMPPKLLRLEALSPTTVLVVWKQPEKLNGEKVWYQIDWQPEKKRVIPSPGWSEVEAFPGQKWSEMESRSNENRTEFHLVVKGLHPGCNYTMWVTAFSEKGDAFSPSENITVRTFPNPGNITLLRATPHALALQWKPPKEENVIVRHQIFYRVGWNSQWNHTEIVNHTSSGTPFNFTISQLKPKTMYGFRIKTWYAGDLDNPYFWPHDGAGAGGQFSLETLADKPGAPGQPIARGIGKSLYEVSWEKAEENGAHVELYSLECRTDSDSNCLLEPLETSSMSPLHQAEDGSGVDSTFVTSRKKREWINGNNNNNKENVENSNHGLEMAEKLVAPEADLSSREFPSSWNVVYNGTEARWEVQKLDPNGVYIFRVRALNSYGWGDYSKESSSVSLSNLTVVAEPQSIGLIMSLVSIGIVFFIVIFVLFYAYRRQSKEKASLQSPASLERREVELATLRELPGGSSFIHQSNILYAASDLVLDLELTGVPQIMRHQISLTKFLGSGAFGEVYEGIAMNLPQANGTNAGTRVAIKTLRKGASSTEKVEFIQEAKLMTQFRHPHILQLLGICIETDPCCLLLELMDGGDLLSYLRANRPHLGSAKVLSLVDLLRMCVDVAKGCVYLEDMHFVHRDLAARNILTLTTNSDPTQETSNQDPSEIHQHGRDRRRRNRVICKIGDFGLARDVYRNDYYRKEGEGLLPVRWMAPESLIDGVYTTQSDVWAFGVLLWEIMTLGQQPYPARNNVEVLHFVRAGGRLQQPAHCPDRLSELMVQCWEFNAENRPSFKRCLAQLELILRDAEGSGQENSHFPSIEPSETQLEEYNNYLQPGSDTKTSTYYQTQGVELEDTPQQLEFPPSHPHHQLSQSFLRHHHHHEEAGENPSGISYPGYTDTLNENVIYSQDPPAACSTAGRTRMSSGASSSGSFPKYLQVLCDSRTSGGMLDMNHTPSLPPHPFNPNDEHSHPNFTSHGLGIPQTITDSCGYEIHGYLIPKPKKPSRNPKNIQLVNRLASSKSRTTCLALTFNHNRNSDGTSNSPDTPNDDDIGLPPPPYWNTSNMDEPFSFSSTSLLSPGVSGSFPFNSLPPMDTLQRERAEEEGERNEDYLRYANSNPSKLIHPHSVLSKSIANNKSYETSRIGTSSNARSQGFLSLSGHSNEARGHFRNLLASTTSTEDGDFSDSDFGSSPKSVFKLGLKTHVENLGAGSKEHHEHRPNDLEFDSSPANTNANPTTTTDKKSPETNNNSISATSKHFQPSFSIISSPPEIDTKEEEEEEDLQVRQIGYDEDEEEEQDDSQIHVSVLPGIAVPIQYSLICRIPPRRNLNPHQSIQYSQNSNLRKSPFTFESVCSDSVSGGSEMIMHNNNNNNINNVNSNDTGIAHNNNNNNNSNSNYTSTGTSNGFPSNVELAQEEEELHEASQENFPYENSSSKYTGFRRMSERRSSKTNTNSYNHDSRTRLNVVSSD